MTEGAAPTPRGRGDGRLATPRGRGGAKKKANGVARLRRGVAGPSRLSSLGPEAKNQQQATPRGAGAHSARGKRTGDGAPLLGPAANGSTGPHAGRFGAGRPLLLGEVGSPTRAAFDANMRVGAEQRRTAALVVLLVHAAWAVLVWYAFTYASLIYDLLGPEAEARARSNAPALCTPTCSASILCLVL